MIKTKKQKTIWFLLALVAIALTAPNNTFLTFAFSELGPLWVSLLRFGLFGIILLPALFKGRQGLNQLNFKYAAIAGLAYGLAVLSVAGSIHFSQASYPALIGISSPIIMLFYSSMLTGEKIPKNSFFGISIAALGGFLVIFLPVLLSKGNGMAVHPMATFFAIVNAFASPMMFVMSKKAVNAGLNIWSSLGLVAWTGALLVAVTILALRLPTPSIATMIQPAVVLPIIYSVIAVMVFSRGMTTLAYKHLGSAPIAGLDYLAVLLSVAVPVVVLGETLTMAMVLGGGLILFGVIAIKANYTPKWLKQNRNTYTARLSRSTID